MFYPALEEIKKAAESGEYKTAPVSREILSDIKTPIEVMRILKNVSSHCYMLESISDNEKWGRYTFLGYDPKLEITCMNGRMKVGQLSFETNDPGKYIKQILDEYKSARFDNLPAFTGGLVGYFSYDYLKYSEPTLNLDAEDTEGFKDVDFSRIKMSVAGGTQIQQVVAERWKNTTGCGILEAYGLTETSPGVCGNLANAPWDGSVGYPVPSTEVTIRGEGFKDLGVCDDPNRIPEFTGEICVKGPQVMKGYWNRPEETAGVFRDCWLRTGDVGFMDSTGKITITDRKKDMILVSGFNVYPNEVEGVIASMPGVLECGVVGVPHERSGETVKAVIVLKDPSITKDDVVKYCRTQLTGYKIPRQIIFVDSLPKTAVGKILRRELKDIK